MHPTPRGFENRQTNLGAPNLLAFISPPRANFTKLPAHINSDDPWRIWLPMWVFPKIGVPQNGWFIMENPIKMDDLGVPLFSETSMSACDVMWSGLWLLQNSAVPHPGRKEMTSKKTIISWGDYWRSGGFPKDVRFSNLFKKNMVFIKKDGIKALFLLILL